MERYDIAIIGTGPAGLFCGTDCKNPQQENTVTGICRVE